MQKIPEFFNDTNFKQIKYDGSPLEWRIAIYGIYLEEDSVLLVKHKGEEYWDFPGGGVEMGEELDEALLREAKEEAGWEFFPSQPVTTHSDFFYHTAKKKFYRSLQHFSLVTGKKVSEPTEKNVEQVQFVSFNELDTHPLKPYVAQALEQAFQLSQNSCGCGGHCSC